MHIVILTQKWHLKKADERGLRYEVWGLGGNSAEERKSEVRKQNKGTGTLFHS
ncbi:MAG: hypothetical protein OHK0040_00740 [bacterium]